MTLFELAAVLTLNKAAFDKGISEAEGQAQGLGGKLKSGIAGGVKAVAGALTASTGAVVGFGKSAVEAGMTFDASMSQVAATMGTTVDEIQDLRNFAQEMGSATAFSASQAADALNYMALAGYDADKSMEMLPNVLNLAAAGGIELAYASDMITDSQSALGLSMDETAELVDKMAKASSKSNTSVAQLGEAILTVGGTAKTLAGGTTELSTALGILADNGVKGAEGGTALRNIILSLSAPTDTAATAMESLGLEAFDAEGNLRPLNETFHDLDEALSTMTQGEQTQALNQIFNKVDLKSVNALLANTNERFDELSGYIDDAAGAAQDMADTQLDNLPGDITLFQSAMEGAQIMLADQLTPTLRDFVQFATNGIGDITKAFSEGGMEGGFSAIGEVLSDGIAMVAEYVPEMVKAGRLLLENLVYGILENAPVFAEGFFTIVKDVIEALPEFIGTAGELIGTGIREIVPIILGNVPIIINGIAEALTAIADSISNSTLIADTVPKLINGLVSIISNNLPKLLRAGLEIIKAIGEGIAKNIPTLVSGVKDIIEAVAGFVSDNLPVIIQTGLDIIVALVDGILQAIPTLVEMLPTVIDTIITVILDSIPLIINAGIQLLTSLVAALPDIIAAVVEAIPTLVEMLLTVIDTIITVILDSIPLIINAGIQLLTSLVAALPDIIAAVVEAIPKIIGGIVDALITSIPIIIQAGVDLLIALVQNLPTIITEIVKAIPLIISGIVEGLFGNIDKIIMAGVQLFVALIENLPTIIVEIVKAVPQIIGGIVDAFGSLMGSIIEIGGNLLKGIWEGITNAGQWLWDQITGFFGGIVDGIKGLLGINSPSTVFADMGKNMALGIGEGFDDEFDGIRKDMNDQMNFTATADVQVNKSRQFNDTYSESGNSAAGYGGSAAPAEKQPLIVVVQLATGVEVARALIEDINDVKRLDGYAY